MTAHSSSARYVDEGVTWTRAQSNAQNAPKNIGYVYGTHRMPVIERRRAFGSPLPKLVEGRLQLPSHQSTGGLDFRSSRILPGFQVPVDGG